MTHLFDDTPRHHRSKQSPLRFAPTNARKSDGILSILVIVGFIVVIGINFVRSWSDQRSKRDHIINRQVELLQQLKNEVDEQYIQTILTEYDSLSTILDELELENNKTQPQ